MSNPDKSKKEQIARSASDGEPLTRKTISPGKNAIIEYAESHAPKRYKEDPHMIIERDRKNRAIIVRPQDQKIEARHENAPRDSSKNIDIAAYDGKLLHEFILTEGKELKIIPHVIIDFEKEQHVSSLFCSALEKAYEALTAQGAQMILAGVTPDLQECLKITGVLKLIGEDNVYASCEEALSPLKSRRLFSSGKRENKSNDVSP